MSELRPFDLFNKISVKIACMFLVLNMEIFKISYVVCVSMLLCRANGESSESPNVKGEVMENS